MIIFGTGVVTGGLLVAHSERVRMARPQHGAGAARLAQPISPGWTRLDFLRRVQKELDLTPEQRERIDKIISASQAQTKKLMEPVEPHLRQEVQKARAEFREVLTPEQRERFDKLIKLQQHPRDQRRPQPAREQSAEATPPGGEPATTNR